MPHVSNPPIVCRPAALTLEERGRSRSLQNELATATKETTELPNGYAFRYAPDAMLFRKAAEWVSLERRCCPFLTFELVWPVGDEAQPYLSVTGPDGTKAFMVAEMPELPHRE